MKYGSILSFAACATALALPASAAETVTGRVDSVLVYTDDGRVKFTLAGLSGNLCGNNPGTAKARIDGDSPGYATAVKIVTSAYLSGKSLRVRSEDTGNECEVEYVQVLD